MLRRFCGNCLEDDLMNDYDDEVLRFVDIARKDNPREAIDVIDNPDTVFEQAKKTFPPLLGGIDWQRASQEFNDNVKSTSDLISVFIEQFVPYAGMNPKSYCIVLSDDFYGLGVRLQCKIVPQLLTDWLPLPHAIFIFSNDLKFVFHVSFIRDVSFGTSGVHQK
jgi:hypothetical protein